VCYILSVSVVTKLGTTTIMHTNSHSCTHRHLQTVLPQNISSASPTSSPEIPDRFSRLLQTLRHRRPTQCRIDNFVQTVLIKWWT
jgi:hypothetical protein